MNTIVFILGVLVVIAMMLAVVYIYYRYRNTDSIDDLCDDGFSGSALEDASSPYWFQNFDIFKRIVNRFAEKDEDIKNYIQSRKNRHDNINTDIHNSGRSGTSDSKDIPSDIQ